MKPHFFSKVGKGARPASFGLLCGTLLLLFLLEFGQPRRASADSGGFPTPTNTPQPTLTPTVTFTPIPPTLAPLPTAAEAAQPKTIPTEQVASAAAQPQAPSSSRLPLTFLCWPFGVAFVLIAILVSAVLISRRY